MTTAEKRMAVADSWVWDDRHESDGSKRYMLLQDFLESNDRYGTCYSTIAECVQGAEYVVAAGDGWFPAAIIDLDTNEQIGVQFTVSARTCGSSNLYLPPLYEYEEDAE